MAGLTLLQDYGTNEEENLGFTDNIVSTPFGSPPYVQIKTKFNRISSSPGSIPTVQLNKAAVPGLEYYIFNDTGNNVIVRSHSNSQLMTIVNGFTGWLRCVAPNKWNFVQLAEANE